jgi:hypothetical protein
VVTASEDKDDEEESDQLEEDGLPYYMIQRKRKQVTDKIRNFVKHVEWRGPECVVSFRMCELLLDGCVI